MAWFTALANAYWGLASLADQDVFGLDARRALAGDDTVFAELVEQLLHGDEVDRLAALALLERSWRGEPGQLPSEAFDGLAERPPIEATRLLELGIPEDVSEDVAALATDAETEPAVRYASLLALGSERDGAQLASTATVLIERGLDQSTGRRLGRALASCGPSCTTVIESLAASPSPTDRRAALRAIALMPHARRQGFAEALANMEATGLTESELTRAREMM